MAANGAEVSRAGEWGTRGLTKFELSDIQWN